MFFRIDGRLCRHLELVVVEAVDGFQWSNREVKISFGQFMNAHRPFKQPGEFVRNLQELIIRAFIELAGQAIWVEFGQHPLDTGNFGYPRIQQPIRQVSILGNQAEFE